MCGLEFKNPTSLDVHLKSVHSVPTQQIKHAQRIQMSETNFLLVLAKDNVMCFTADGCNTKYSNMGNARRHYKTKHGETNQTKFGINPESKPKMSPGMSPGMSASMSPGMSHGMSPAHAMSPAPGMSSGMSHGMSHAMSPGMSHGMSPAHTMSPAHVMSPGISNQQNIPAPMESYQASNFVDMNYFSAQNDFTGGQVDYLE